MPFALSRAPLPLRLLHSMMWLRLRWASPGESQPEKLCVLSRGELRWGPPENLSGSARFSWKTPPLTWPPPGCPRIMAWILGSSVTGEKMISVKPFPEFERGSSLEAAASQLVTSEFQGPGGTPCLPGAPGGSPDGDAQRSGGAFLLPSSSVFSPDGADTARPPAAVGRRAARRIRGPKKQSTESARCGEDPSAGVCVHF